MVAYADVFDRDQQLKKPFIAAVTLHLTVTALVGGWTWYMGRARDTFGESNTIPGAGVVTTVDTIPMPSRRGQVNPVANDTPSQVPARAKPEAKRKDPDDPDAVALGKKTKNRKEKKRQVEMPRRYTPPRTYDPELASATGAAAVTEMLKTPGGGGVGFGVGNPFGQRLGWYADLIRRAIGQKWRPQDVDASVTSADAIITFEIHRDGNVGNVRVAQRSSNYTLDTSAVRAVQEATPLPPLPREFERNTATVELHFQLKR